MAAYKRLKSPPIVEAVLDFRIRNVEGFDGRALANVTESFKSSFPITGLLRQRAVELSLEPGHQSVTSETITGARFDNGDRTKVAVFGVEGFTFSHVNSYSHWDALKADALSAWGEYTKIVQPQEITRVGLRYVNRFDFVGQIELKDFFTAAPELPPGLPQVLDQFHSRIIFPLPGQLGFGSLAHVAPKSPDSSFRVILDIDIYKENTGYDAIDMRAWDLLDKFREEKNRVFFEAVTEHALEKFL